MSSPTDAERSGQPSVERLARAILAELPDPESDHTRAMAESQARALLARRARSAARRRIEAPADRDRRWLLDGPRCYPATSEGNRRFLEDLAALDVDEDHVPFQALDHTRAGHGGGDEDDGRPSPPVAPGT